MREIASGVWQLTTSLFIHSYLASNVLFDTGGRRSARPMPDELRGRRIRAVALTHVHPDHRGGAHFICGLGILLDCPVDEVDRMEGRRLREARCRVP